MITRGAGPGRMGECQGLSAGAETPRRSGVAHGVGGKLGEPLVLEAMLRKHFKEQRSTASVSRTIDAMRGRRPVVISVPGSHHSVYPTPCLCESVLRNG